jgi:hypothetical protein
MAIFQKKVIISEAVVVIVYWAVVLLVPILFSLHMRQTLSEMANHVPFDMILLTETFCLWFDVHTMNVHGDLLRSLSLSFDSSLLTPFLHVTVRAVTGFKGDATADMRKEESLGTN